MVLPALQLRLMAVQDSISGEARKDSRRTLILKRDSNEATRIHKDMLDVHATSRSG